MQTQIHNIDVYDKDGLTGCGVNWYSLVNIPFFFSI